MRYGKVEAALIRMHKVPANKLGAFQARIRHLRRFDCPPIVKAERGAPAEYTRENAIELALALSVAQIGMTPRWAAFVAKFWIKNLEVKQFTGRTWPTVGQIVLPPDADYSGLPTCSIFRGSLEFPSSPKHGPVVTLVNLSQIIVTLDAELAAETE